MPPASELMSRFTEQVPRRRLAARTGAVILAAFAIAGCGASAHHESATAAATHSTVAGAADSTSTSAATADSTSTSSSQAGSSAGATGGDHSATGSHRHARARAVVLTAAEKRAATSKIARSVPARVPNSVAARRNATLASCHSADGGWQADGTVKHAGGSPASYKITVFFTTSSATVIGYGDTVIQVAAGQTKPWTVRGTFDAPKGTRCVLRGVALTA
jgi:hypothetical protein